jgi:DNA-binding NarL/FixJ family response regulator
VTIRVLIADDERLVRTGFRLILGSEPDLEVVGEATTGHEAVAITRELHPDVVLMDIRMPELDGIEATRRIVGDPGEPGSRVLILTTFDLDEYVFAALRAGASGFVLKDAPADQLVAGVRMVAAGEALLAPSVTRRLIEVFARAAPKSAPSALDDLTAREVDVLKLMAKGLSNAEIAAQLIIGEATVRTHVTRVLRKLDLRDRVQVVVLAHETGLVDSPFNPFPDRAADGRGNALGTA